MRRGASRRHPLPTGAPALQVATEPSQGSPLDIQAQASPDLTRTQAADKMPIAQQCFNRSPRRQAHVLASIAPGVGKRGRETKHYRLSPASDCLGGNGRREAPTSRRRPAMPRTTDFFQSWRTGLSLDVSWVARCPSSDSHCDNMTIVDAGCHH